MHALLMDYLVLTEHNGSCRPQLALLKKGIPYTVKPTLPTAKPDWLVKNHGGDMPALVHKDVTLTNSLAIAEYIEKTFPHSSLTRQGVYSYQEVLEKTAGFFPALAAYIKNKDSSKEEELGAAVETQLDLLDEIIRSTPGHYICGIELTLADLYLAPQLFHVSIIITCVCSCFECAPCLRVVNYCDVLCAHIQSHSYKP